MSDFISLTCPSCGGKLSAAQYQERVVCDYCGVEHILKWDESGFALAPMLVASRSIAGELKIQRLQDEISTLQVKRAEIYNPGSWAMGCAGVGGFFVVIEIAFMLLADLMSAWWLIVAEVAVLVAMILLFNSQMHEYQERVKPIDELLERKKRELSDQFMMIDKPNQSRGALPGESKGQARQV